MRAVFLGTPDAAVPSLIRLRSIAEVVAVFTQPDRPRGRSKQPQPPPVRETAERLGIRVLQPAKSAEVGPLLETLGPIDVAVIVAYGMLIRPDALAVPKAGFLNVHFSLLPRWRGAAPVQHAIAARDRRIGVTLMQLDRGLDTGPTISSTSIRLAEEDTTGQMLEQLSGIGARLLGLSLPEYLDLGTTPIPQDDADATHAPKITGDDQPVAVSDDASGIVAQIHSLSPRPGATVQHETGSLKLLQARVNDASSVDRPGTIRLTHGQLFMDTGDQQVELLRLQPAGRAAMAATDWARGRQGSLGRFS